MAADADPDSPTRTGGCACGAVRYSVRGPLRPVIACHCRTCRHQSGHVMAATRAPRKRVAIAGAANLTWYNAREYAERGFCATCGSHLFFQPLGSLDVSIFAGSLDDPTGLALAGHIHVAEKADYDIIADGLPCCDAGDAAAILNREG